MRSTVSTLADVRKLQIIEATIITIISLTKCVKYGISKNRKKKEMLQCEGNSVDSQLTKHVVNTIHSCESYWQFLNVSRGFSALNSAIRYYGIDIRC
jgi:uncharacterized membrane protein YhfC